MSEAHAAILMSVPRDERSPRLVRVTAAAWAGDHGFRSDDIDNWRIAVDELCTALVRLGDGERIEVEFVAADHELLLRGHTSGSVTAWDGSDFDLARQILAVVAHAYTFVEREGEIEFQLCQPRAIESNPGGDPT